MKTFTIAFLTLSSLLLSVNEAYACKYKRCHHHRRPAKVVVVTSAPAPVVIVKPRKVWVEGHWKATPRGTVWVPAHWARR